MRDQLLSFFTCAAVIFLISACTTATDRELATDVPRYVMLPNGDIPLQPGVRSQINKDLAAALINKFRTRKGEPLHILQLSGGGQNGAFGAGFLNGWSQSGKRPQFDIVTGVSTGNLIATFAFLGTTEDDKLLKDLWLGLNRKDIYIKGGMARLIAGGNSLYDSSPLKELVARIITRKILDRVAKEYDKGRRLFVSTTNIDYDQTWVWDLTAIAKYGGEEALDLYRKTVLASASPPILFSPIEINGFMFVDGGTRHNLLIMGLMGNRDNILRTLGDDFDEADFKGNVYVIMHHQSASKNKAVRESVRDLISRSANIVVHTATIDSVLRSYFVAELQDINFNIAYIPDDLEIDEDVLTFDPDTIRRMYESGRAMAKNAEPWEHQPRSTGEIGPWLMDEVVKRFNNQAE